MNPIEKYNARVEKINSLVCVGLDPDEFPQFEFNKKIIDATAEFAAAFKPNIAFYEAHGGKGLAELKKIMEYLQKNYPDIFTICDAKRADIGNTNERYVAEIFDYFGFDALTLHPYLGQEALHPFLERTDKVSIILCRTSNPGAGELQDLIFTPPSIPPPRGEGSTKEDSSPLRGEERWGWPLWQVVAEKVSREWNKNENCMLVVGATYPKELTEVRKIVGDMTLLVPGVGMQGANVKDAVQAGLNSQKKGLIINSSRGIIFAADPAAEAKKLRDEINEYR